MQPPAKPVLPPASIWPIVAIVSLLVMVPLSLVIGYKVGKYEVYSEADFHGHGRWIWYHDKNSKMQIWQWNSSVRPNDR